LGGGGGKGHLPLGWNSTAAEIGLGSESQEGLAGPLELKNRKERRKFKNRTGAFPT